MLGGAARGEAGVAVLLDLASASSRCFVLFSFCIQSASARARVRDLLEQAKQELALHQYAGRIDADRQPPGDGMAPVTTSASRREQ